VKYIYQVISYLTVGGMGLPSHVIHSERAAKAEAKSRMVDGLARACAVQRLSSFDSVDRVRFYRLGEPRGRHVDLVAHRSLASALSAASALAVRPVQVFDGAADRAAAGCGRRGTVRASPVALAVAFPRHSGDGDGCKVHREYTFRLASGAVATVYDYRFASSPWRSSRPAPLSLGARDASAADLNAFAAWLSGRVPGACVTID